MSRKHAQRIIIGAHIFRIDAADSHERGVVGDAAGVIEQMAKGYLRTVVWQFRHVSADVVIERDFVVADQEKNAGRGKLFGDRRNLKGCLLGIDGDAKLNARQTVALLVNRAPLVELRQGTSW